MSKPTLGVIGTGDFATYLIAALRKGGHDGRILLSPHSPAKAHAIAARYGCEVAADEAGMVGEADWILLAIRPERLEEVLARLSLRPGQMVISAVAGAAVARLRAALGQEAGVVRILPSSYIDTVSQGIVPMYPLPPRSKPCWKRPAGSWCSTRRTSSSWHWLAPAFQAGCIASSRGSKPGSWSAACRRRRPASWLQATSRGRPAMRWRIRTCPLPGFRCDRDRRHLYQSRARLAA